MIQCQRCHEKRPDVRSMADHLVNGHLISPSVANLEASDYEKITTYDERERPISTPPIAEDAMARKCSKCGKKGHDRRLCPEAASKPAAEKKPASVKKMETSSLKTTATEYLDQLRQLRDKLDEHISSVETMTEIL